jgi:hypothetical protein
MFENKMFNNMLSKNKNYYKNIINNFFEDGFIKKIKFSKNGENWFKYKNKNF